MRPASPLASDDTPADQRAREPFLDREGFLVPPGVYLASHALGPLPVAARERANDWLDEWAMFGAERMAAWWGVMERYRALLAELFGGRAGEWCPQPNVSAALSRWIGAVTVTGRRDRILLTDLEFPTVGFVATKSKRFRTTILGARGPKFDLGRWRAALDDDVAIAVVSHGTYDTGTLLPVQEMIEMAHGRGAQVVVDVAQSAGVAAVDVTEWGADAVVGTCVKWLCGGPGTGFLWVRPDTISALDPVETGWLSQEMPLDLDIRDFRPASDARRFFGGTPAFLPLVVATTGLERVRAIGVEAIRAHNQKLIERLLEGARTAGIRVQSPDDPSERSGTAILGLKHAAVVTAWLAEHGVTVDHRGSSLRVSPHIFNETSEVDRLLSLLIAASG